MRPTMFQVYCDPHAIVGALETAGVENAHAKVFSMMRHLCEYFYMEKYIKRIDRDRTYTHQNEDRRKKWKDYQDDPYQRRRDQKQVAEYDKTIVVGRGYLKRRAREIETRIAKWPELDIDPETLAKKPNNTLVREVLKKRMKRNKRRTFVLG